MTLLAMLFMSVALAAVTALVTWCYYKVLSDPSQKKQDEERP